MLIRPQPLLFRSGVANLVANLKKMKLPPDVRIDCSRCASNPPSKQSIQEVQNVYGAPKIGIYY